MKLADLPVRLVRDGKNVTPAQAREAEATEKPRREYSAEARARISDRQKQRWAAPGARERLKASWADPAKRAERIANIRRALAERAARLRVGGGEDDVARRAKIGAGMRRAWADPAKRERLTAGIRRGKRRLRSP
jgi:hypothetical protein